MSGEINFMVGGEAGQGVQTVGFVLAKTMARQGLHVFADQDYESRVRGGHNFYRVRAADRELGALNERVDVLIAIDQQTIELHHEELKQDGIAIFDHDKIETEGKKLNSVNIPLERLAEDVASNKLMANTVAVGAAIAVGGYPFEVLEQVLREQFAHLGGEIVEDNVKAARAGHDHASRHGPGRQATISRSNTKRMLLNGNEAIALGAMAAGCKFVAAYPMTPASSIMEYIADKGRAFNVVVIQPEDEIAAANMVIGAGYAGVRAMTATSGGGFALMVEAVSMAGISETPFVAVLAQRPGPAVGLPTRTEQGELLLAIHSGHGEFPKAVMAPIDVRDAFHVTVKAFNLAEKYQTPVIILTDQHLASSHQTVDRFDLSQVKIERGQMLSEEEMAKSDGYQRHRITDSGISPRAIPGLGRALVATDSDEHDEAGHMIEDGDLRTRMVLKRMRKLQGIRSELGSPRLEQRSNPQMTLVGWGSSFGAISEAASIMAQEGISANVLQLNELWPFPAKQVTEALKNGGAVVVVENNATGQLARLIRTETGIGADHRVAKFDGRPFSPRYIMDALRAEASLRDMFKKEVLT